MRLDASEHFGLLHIEASCKTGKGVDGPKNLRPHASGLFLAPLGVLGAHDDAYRFSRRARCPSSRLLAKENRTKVTGVRASRIKHGSSGRGRTSVGGSKVRSPTTGRPRNSRCRIPRLTLGRRERALDQKPLLLRREGPGQPAGLPGRPCAPEGAGMVPCCLAVAGPALAADDFLVMSQARRSFSIPARPRFTPEGARREATGSQGPRDAEPARIRGALPAERFRQARTPIGTRDCSWEYRM